VRASQPIFTMASAKKSPTESEVLVREFLAANPDLNSKKEHIYKMVHSPGLAGAHPATATDRYTNQEWAAQIQETQKKVKGDAEKRYESPRVGSKEFAETIDHTVLKLDATPSQIDALCSEARTEGFKVGFFSAYSILRRDQFLNSWIFYSLNLLIIRHTESWMIFFVDFVCCLISSRSS
jgi:hypothetical protein